MVNHLRKSGKLMSVSVVLLMFIVQSAIGQNQCWPWKDCPSQGNIGYVQPDATSVPVPPVQGDRYEDLVPDTPDVAEMSKLAINALTCATNPLQDHEQYFSVYYGNPLHMAHRFDDWCTPKFTEAAALLRVVTGSDYMAQVDQVWLDALLKSIGPDGLFYFPIEGKPWYGKKLVWANAIIKEDGSMVTNDSLKNLDMNATYADGSSVIQRSGITQFTHPQPVGRVMMILAIYYLRDGNPMWLEMIDKMANRFDELAVKKDDYAYFGAFFYAPNAKLDTTDPSIDMPQGIRGGEICGRFIRACALAHRLTGNKTALKLAGRLTNFMIYHDQYFNSDGEFLDVKDGHQHFHDHTNYVLGILEYAHETGDKKLLDFCKGSFQWAKSIEYGFGPVTGFTPERAYPNYPSSEGCAVADMVVIACKLSDYGVKDYYNEAERWFRNYFSEIQLTKAKADNMVRHFSTLPHEDIPYNETEDSVAQRNIGSFSGWAGGNEWWVGFRDTDKLLMHCCTGNGARALYFVWNSILQHKDGELKINMLINRASPWADVYSFIPYQGRVEIRMKQTCKRVLVHTPEWIEPGSSEIQATVDGSPRAVQWEGKYMSLGEVKAKQRIVITCPITERVVKEKMGLEMYTLLVRGNTVVGIDPPGRICPLFQRDYLRSDQPRWRKVERFVADKPIDY